MINKRIVCTCCRKNLVLNGGIDKKTGATIWKNVCGVCDLKRREKRKAEKAKSLNLTIAQYDRELKRIRSFKRA